MFTNIMEEEEDDLSVADLEKPVRLHIYEEGDQEEEDDEPYEEASAYDAYVKAKQAQSPVGSDVLSQHGANALPTTPPPPLLTSDVAKDRQRKRRRYSSQIALFVSRSFDQIRALLIRVIFAVHLFTAIVMVSYLRDDLWYMVNTVGIVFIIIEWYAVALPHSGKDLPWFSPSFFIYIATIIPPTWFLELENIRLKTLSLKANGAADDGSNGSIAVVAGSLSLSTTLFDQPVSIPPLALHGGAQSSENGLTHTSDLFRFAGSTQNYAMYIEVSMMLIIIIGRWVMPKKGITRSELSQLLLVYMSLASDIIDLLSMLQEHKIMVNEPMVYSTLSVYSWSLFQFTLNLVGTRGRMTGQSNSKQQQQQQSDQPNISKNEKQHGKAKQSAALANANRRRANNRSSMHHELYNVMITLCMQDCPFFVLRTIGVLKFNIVSYLFLFFTFKNGILFSLQIYRIVAICTDQDYNFDPANEAETNHTSSLSHMVTMIPEIGSTMIPRDIRNESKKLQQRTNQPQLQLHANLMPQKPIIKSSSSSSDGASTKKNRQMTFSRSESASSVNKPFARTNTNQSGADCKQVFKIGSFDSENA